MNIRAFGRLLFSGFALPKLAFRESNFLPEPKPKSLFEALRSKSFVRRMAIAMVLAMGAGFVALQANANPTLRGENSTIDRYLQVNVGGPTNQYAQHPDTNFTNGQTNGTWEAWIYPTRGIGTEAIFSKENSYVFGLHDGKFWAYTFNGAWRGATSADVSVPINSWSHVAFIKIGEGIVIYLNGEEVIYLPTGAFSTLSNFQEPFTIGRRTNGEYFSGRIDEVRVWTTDRRNLIASNMHTKITGSNTTGLHGYWDFNEPSGNTVFDRTTGSYIKDLTLVNSPTRADVKTLSAASNGDTVITFNRTYLPSSGNWTVPAAASRVRALVAAGGGGGGGYIDGGGGGAGGVVEFTSPSLTLSGDVKITVGQGGNGGYNTYAANNHGLMGQDSYLGTVRALGGGGGGGYGYEWNLAWAQGWSGGSGGGHAEYGGDIAPAAGTQRTDAVTYSGGTEYGNNGGSIYRATQAGSGGGGASSAGGNVTAFRVGGAGGSAMTSDISGTSASYAGGGGGGDRDGAGASGGSGVGGNGGGTAVPTNGAANTGSGGGGADGERGANGGSGVVIVRYTPASDRAVDLAGNINSSLTGPTGVIPSGAFTVESWVYMRSNVSQTILSEGVAHPGSTVYIATIANGQIYLRWGGSEATTGVVAPTNRWVHFALTRSASGVPKFFIDGAEVWTSATTSALAPGAGSFRVGIQVGDGSFLNGQVDQIKVWGVDLTAAELALSMHSYGANQSSGTAIRSGVTPRAHYDFNEFTDGGVEPDRSGNGRSLTHASAISTSSYTDAQIVETGTVFSSMQTYVEFNRTYLTATGGWTRPTAVSNYKVLAVAGGGGGGVRHGGGGGAGEVLDASSVSLGATVPIVVGQGGVGYLAGGPSGDSRSGQDTVVGTITLKGGGGSNKQGGSGGGNGNTGATGQASNKTNTNTASQTFLGNSGGTLSSSGNWTGGGGGGAGSAGFNAVANTRGGTGGSGYVSSITGTRACYAAGGGGGAGPTSSNGTGPGGSCADLASSTIGGVGGWRHDTAGTAGTANTGSGGGGGGFNDSGSPANGASGSGGSGVVILSYGATMEVTQTPSAATAGRNFNRAITVQLKNTDGTNYTGADQQVTITAASGSILQQTIGATTTNITSTTTTSRSGVATFSGIGFQSGVSGVQTLAVTAESFVGTTLSVTPTFLPTAVTISTSASTNGSFIEGSWVSTTAAASNIQASALASELAARDVTIEASGATADTTIENGSVIFQTPVTKAAGSDRTITIRASKNVHMDTHGISSTSSKLNVIVWSDFDATNGGGVILDGPASGYLIDTNGGHLAIGGGSASTSWNALTIPSGYAQSNNSFGTAWWGIELGVNQNVSNLKLIRTLGGNLRLYGDSNSGAANTTMLFGIAWEGGEINTGIGSVELNGKTSRDTNAAGGPNYGVGIGINWGTANDTPKLVTSGGVTVTGTTGGTYTQHEGVYVAYADFSGVSSTVTMTTDRRAQIATSNTFGSQVNLSASGRILVSGASSFNGTNGGKSAVLTSTGAGIDLQGAVTTSNAIDLSCVTGAFASTSAGTITTSGNLDIDCSTVTTAAAIATTGTLSISSVGTTTIGAATSATTLLSVDSGSIVQNANLTSASGSITLTSTGASATFTKSTTSTITAAQDVSITSASSTVNTTGTGTISAGTVRLSSSTGMTSAAPISSRGLVAISNTTGTATVSATTNAAGNLTISSPTVSVTATQTTTNAGNITITPTAAYSGAGQLSSAGSITISGGTTVDPTGAIQAVSNVVLRGSGQITTATGATLTSSGGSVEVRTTGGLVTLGKNVLASDSITVALTGAYSGVGTLTATNGSISISGGTSVAPTGAIAALGNISLSGSAAVSNSTATLTSTSGSVSVVSTGTTVTVSAAVSASTSVTLRANTELSTSAAITSSTSRVSLTSTTTSISVGSSVAAVDIEATPKTTYGGAGSLTASAGTVRISGGTSIAPTGAIRATGDITLSGSAAFTNTGASLTTTGGSISITSTASTVTISAALSAPVDVSLTAYTELATSAAVTATSGTVSATSTTTSINLGGATSGTSVQVTPKTTYVGAGTVTATTGTISITGGTSIEPTANFTAQGDVTLTGSGRVYLNDADVVSRAGAISLTGGPVASHGVLIRASTVSATTGRITLNGSSTGANISVYLYEASTVSTTSGAIQINATSTGERGLYAIGSSTISTGSGDIDITSSGGPSSWSIWFEALSILSTSGNITIDSGTRGMVNGYGATTTIGATSSGSASGNITVLSDLHWDGSTVVNYKTTGAIVLNSKASSYSAAVGYANHTFNGASSVNIGNANSNQTLTVDAVGTIQGPFNVFSQYVLVDASTSLTTNRGASGNSSRNIGVLVKATDRIELQSGAKFTTNGSDMVFWSDSDNNGVGAQYFGGSNILKSNGGNLTFAGGLDDGAVTNTEFVGRVANDGHPDNYAGGISGWGSAIGVQFLNGYELLSGGGNIFVAGRGSAAANDDDMGVAFRGGLVYSGSGKIAAYGKGPVSCTNSWHRGVFTGWSGRTHIVSESTAEDAIYIYGNTTWCNSGFSVYSSAVQGYSNYTDIVTPNGGGIKIYGTQGNASHYAGTYGTDYQESNILQLNYVNLISNSGPISAHADEATTYSGRWLLRFSTMGGARSDVGQISASVSTGYTGYPTIASVASSSDVTLKADNLAPVRTTFNTTGDLSFIPDAEFETADLMYFSSDWAVQIPKKLASFTFGAPASGGSAQSGADVDLLALSSSGSINVYGGTITQEGTISSDDDVTLSGTENVTVGFAVTAGDAAVIQTSGGDVTLNAGTTAGAGGINATASQDVKVNASTTAGAGGVNFKAGRDVLVDTATKSITTSSAGNIVFWGNSAGSGGEVDTGGANVTINSSGGDIVIAGGADDGANGGTSADGIPDNYLLGRTWNHTARLLASMTSGNGDILVRAQATSGSTASAQSAIRVNAGVQITATAGTIRFDARQNSGNTSASNQYGIWLGTEGVKAVIRSATGDIILNGDASQSNRAQRRGIALLGVDIIATAGNIELNGTSPAQVESFDVLGWATSTVTAGGNILVSGARTSATEFITFNAGGTTTLTVGQLIGGDAGTNTSTTTSVATAFAGSGSVVIQPTSTSFTAAQTLANVTMASSLTGLTVGKSGNTAGVTLPVAYTIAGDLNVFSGAVTVSANQATTNLGNITITASGDYTGSGTLTSAGDLLINAAATTVGAAMQANGDLDIVSTSLSVTRSLTSTVGRIYLKSTDNIVVQAGSSLSSKTNIQAPGGDITLQSDSDGDNDGYIWIQNYTNISTGNGGGDILISGGSNPLTGFATAASGDGDYRPGVHLGAFSTNASYAEGVTLASGSGDLTLRGKAVGNSAGRGVLIPLSSTEANKSSITGTNITIVGESAGANSWYGIEIGNAAVVTASNVKTLFNATGTLSLTGTSSNYDGVGAWGNYEFIGNRITITGSGPRRPVALFYGASSPSSIAAGSGGFSFSATKSGTVVNDDAAFQPGSFSSSGSVSLVFDASTSSVAALTVTAPISVTNTDVTVRSNNVSLTGSINAGTGAVKFEPFTSSRALTAGTEVSGTLSLTAAELGTITASTLRLETGGNLDVTSNLTFTNKVSTLAIRAGGNVSVASGLSVVVANLGIDAGGNISWPGTGHNAAVIALNAGASGTISFGQSANYSVAVVDGIDPEFGLATKFVLSNVDRTNTVDRFMAVTFNPPPAVVLQDKFNNPLATNNLSASGYVVRSTMSVTRTDSGTLTLDGSTPTSQGGTSTFTALRVNGGTGLVAISYSATSPTGTSLVDASTGATSTSINYLIRAGEPASIDLTFSSTTTRAGLTGLSPTATLKDSTGGTLTTGDYKNATVTITMTGDTNRIISGSTAPTTDGVARFPNLVVAGTAGTNAYTLTFSVSFLNSSNVTQTVSRSQVISITAGTPTTLAISSTSQTVVNRASLSDIALTVQDDYGNAAAFNSSTSIATTLSAGSNLGLTPTLSGTTTRSTDNLTSTATFSGLSLSAKVDTYTLTFSSGSLTSTSHTVRVTHGAASALTISAPSTAANDRTFGSNVVVDIVDMDGNVVTSGDQSTQTITLDANTTLTGTRAMSATAGRATFTNLRMLGLVGTKTLEASIGVPSSISNTASIVLEFGDATRVALTRQAAGIVNRADFTTQPVLAVLDSSGNVVTNHSQSITVTRAAVDAAKPATLTGTRTILPSSGVVTFTNLRLEGRVGEFDLTFESGSISSSTQRVTLTHGAVENVVVTGATTASNARIFGSAIRVEIQDFDGNLVTSGTAASQNVVLSVSGSTLSGTTTRQAVFGAVEFNDLVLTGSTGAKTLTATISDPATKTGTRTITVAHGAATQLVLTTSASQAVSRQNFGVQPVIQVRDVSGNPVSDFVGRVSVAVSRVSGTPFSLTGTRVIDLNGSPIATFSGLGLYGEVGDFTLTYTGIDTGNSQNLTSATQSITLAHGTATNLLITSPTTARNAITLGSNISVEIRDQDNNRVTGSNEQVTLSISDATISGTAQRNAASGIATFDSLAFIGVEGAKTLTATLASPSLTETAALTLEYGEATKLAISQAASGAVNRANFSIQPIIQAQDVSGNVVDDYTSSVSIAVSRSASAVTFGLSGTGALNASAGVATFTGLSLFGETGDYTLTYSSGSLTTTSQTLRLTHGIATQVKIIDGPGGVQNGATFGRSIATQIQDQDGNVVSTGSDATAIVTLTPSGATLTGTRSKASSSGTASFGDLVMTGTTGSKTITATTATFTSAAYSVTLNVGAATKLVLTTSATGIVNRVDFATQPAVTVQDSSGNTVTSYSTDVTVSATPVDGSITATITGTLSRTPSTGISTFTNLRLDGKVGQYDLTFSSGSLSSTTQRVTLTHGAATAVVLSGATTSSNARTIATNIVAEIQDADANRVTTGSDSNQSVVITASGALLSGTNTVNASAGVATFSNLTLTGTVGTKTLTAKILSPSEITGTRSIELAHGQATQLAIVTAASEALNRTAFTIQPVISVRDVSGNPVSDFVGRVSVAVSSSGSNTATLSGTTYRDLSGSPTATFSGLGLGGTLGSYTLTYSATDLTSATQNIVLAHGTATTLELVAPTTADNARVISTDVVVRLKDADGNLVTTGTPEVTLSISGATISGTAVRNLASGEVSFPGLKFVGLSGSKTLSASITSPVSLTTTSPVQLSFGDATKLVVTTQASGAVNRQLFTTQPAVTVQDVSGNPVTSFAGTINLSVSPADAALSGTTSRVLSGSAVAYFDDLALNGKIGSYTLTFESTGLTADSQSISVEHGAATSLTVSVPASAVNNVGITDVVVRVLDQDLNLVTTGTPSISLAGSSAELTGTLVRNASSGIATFPGLKFIGEIGNKNVTASAASLSLTSMTSTVNLTYGAATQLVLTTPASSAVNRMAFATGAVVTLKDISGNTVIDSSATVTVSESSSAVALSGTANRTPINGVVSFSALGLNGTVGSYTLTYSSAGLTDITQTIDLTHGAATKIDIVTSAATSRSGQVFGTQPAVRILDQDNNLVSTGASSTATITAALTGLSDPAPVALNGTVALAAVGGELTFVGLGLNGRADNYTIRYSSPNIASASQSIALLAGTPTAINIITGPANAIAGAGFGSAVSVELRDSANNRVLSDSTTYITATLVSSIDVSTRAVSTTTVRVTNGLATFTGLNYTLAGDHKISFEAGALSQISSSFTITHAIASKFTIQTQPAAMRNDIVVGVAPALRIFDAYDNPVLSGDTVGVTATVVGSNSSDITAISGNTTSSTANTNLVGLANLKLKGKVSDYVIRFTGSVSGTSFTIDSDPTALTFGTPTQLVLTQSAAGARAGLAFDTQPQLAIRDNSDNLVADSTLRVTATVTGRSLVGTSAVSASSGVVSFTGSGLGIAGEAATGLVIRYATQTLTGSTLEVSQNIDLTPGAAVKLSIIQQPATVLTRLEFANDVSVQLLDQYDNPVPSDSTSDVSIQLFKGLSPALATGGSTLTLTAKRASSGVATFNGLTLPVEPAADYFLKFTIGSFTVVSSQFEVLPGAVSSMAITQQPSTVVGSGLSRTGDLIAVQPQVTLYDADGYLARGASGNVTVAISSGVGGNLTEGTITAAVSNGVARFEGVRLVGTPAQQSAAAVDYRLRFSFTNEVSTVITSPESNVLKVTNAAASKLIISRGAASGDAGRDFRTQPIVHIVDRYNNIVETGSDANLLVIASSPTADSLSDNQVNAASGVATFEDLALGGQVNTNYSIVFEVENRGDITSVTQSNIQIGFGLANKLRIVTQPASLSGSDLTKSGDTLPTQPVVEILDSFNNRVTNSNRQISITLTRDGAALDAKDRLIGGVATPSSGVATFSGVGVVGRPGDTYKLAFSATGLTGVTSAALVVRHGDPTVLEFVDQPVSILGGVLTKTGSLLAGQPKLRLLDFDGNVATEINDVSVSAFVARGGGSTLTEVDSNNVPKNTVNFVNGVATFTNLAVIATPGIEQALRFETVVRGATLQSSESSGISFTHGDAHQLAISTQPCAGAVVSAVCETGITGEDLTVQPVIEVQDRYGNRVVNFSGEITVSTTANRGQLSDRDLITVNEITATASSGVATFTGLNLVATPGDQVQLLFTSGSLNSVTSNAITVRAAAATSIAVVTEPVGARTGSVLAIDPVIELRDRFGNLAASDNVSRITVTSSSGTLTGTTTATATAGRVTFSGLSYTGVPGLYATLTFTGVNGANVALTGISSSGFTVKNALANTAVITQQPTATATGALLGEAVIALRDFDNNLAEDDSATVVRVEIAAGDGLARFVNESDQTIVDSATSTILRQTASGGVVRFNGLRLVGTPGVSYQLIFTANPDNSGASYATVASNALVLTHAEPASLSVTDNPVGDMTNTALITQPALRVLDRYGNLATSNNTMVVTATLFESTGGVIRSGGSATAVGGIVTFSGLTVDGTPGALYKLRFTAGGITVDDTIGFRLKKNADIALSYDPVNYSPSGTVTRLVVTDSPGTPVYSTTSSSSICTVNSSTGVVSIIGVGDCMVNVLIPNTTYYVGGNLNALLVINKANQASISVTSSASVPYLQSRQLTALGGSGTGALIFSATGNCRVVDSILIPGDINSNSGTSCRVRVEREADANYELKVSDWQTITVTKITQAALVIGNSSELSVGDVNLFTHGGSGPGAVTYLVDPDDNDAQCQVLSATVLRAGADGTCSVTAFKAGSPNFIDTQSALKTFTFQKAAQTVYFTSTIPERPLAGGDLYQPVATSSSGLGVTYSITSGNNSVCRFDLVETTKVQFLTMGNCEITATQAGDSQYVSARAKQVIAVGLRNQSITFMPLEDQRYGQPAFMLTATASSGLAVSFQLDSAVSSQACRVTTAGLVSIDSAGTCAIKASQPGNSTFQAAPDVTQKFTVTPDRAGAPHLVSVSASDQTITATFTAPSYLGGSDITRYRMEVSQVGSTNKYVNFACQANPLVPCRVSGLPNANNESYTVRVAAVTAAGIGAYSRSSEPLSTAEASAAVSNLTASASSTRLDLVWDEPIAIPGTFQSYQVYVWPMNDSLVPSTPTITVTDANADGTSITVTSPSGGGQSLRRSVSSVVRSDAYNIRVVTITNRISVAQPTNTSNGMKIGATTPGEPDEVELNDLSDKVIIGWSAPTFDGGHPVLGYIVKVNGEIACDLETQGGQQVCEDSDQRIFEWSELSVGSNYLFEIAAVNLLGVGSMASDTHNIPAPVAPGSGSGGTYIPGTPVGPGPAKPDSGTSGPDVLNPDSWNPTAPGAESPGVDPVAPAEPKPETNASGEQNSVFDPSWLLWLLLLISGGGGLSLLARRRRRKPRQVEGFVYPSPIAESTQYKDS